MPNISRRQLLAVSAAGVIALATNPLKALDALDYSTDIYDALNAAGKPFLIDFYATWCSTCKAQERVIEKLQADGDGYENIPVLRVDWDKFGNSALVHGLGIPRRSTLVVMQSDNELGRVVAQTGESRIKALLDLAI